MSLTNEDVQHIAHLARLQLTDEETQRFRDQLSSILEHVTKLQDLDTTDVQPMNSLLAENSRLRDDVAGECLTTEQLLSNAPDVHSNQFRVPQVLDQDSN